VLAPPAAALIYLLLRLPLQLLAARNRSAAR